MVPHFHVFLFWDAAPFVKSNFTMQITQTNQSNAESTANLKGRRKGSKLILMNACDDNLDKNLEYWQKEYMMQWLEQNEHNVIEL